MPAAGSPCLPVAISGRGARLPGSVAAIGLVAVLIVAVVGGRLSSPQEGAASGAAGTHVPESIPTLAVSGPDSAAVPPEAVPESWTGAELATALGARSIVGQVVVVDGPFTTRLCNPGGSCVVDIDGLEGVRVVFPHAPQGVPPLIGPGSRTVLRVREDGGLDYLGQLDRGRPTAAHGQRPRARVLDAGPRALRRRPALAACDRRHRNVVSRNASVGAQLRAGWAVVVARRRRPARG